MATVPSNPAFAPTLSTRGRLNGILFVALFALAVTQLAALPAIANLGISPLIVGIVAGALYGNALRDGVPASWAAGINFSARGLLRIAVAFFGLRVSLQEIAEVGWSGLIVSLLVVSSTLLIGLWCGMRLFKLDRDTALLTAAGSAICGAAAVLAFESALRSAPHKSAMAVGSVVLFGTLSMFLYPLAINAGWLHLDTMGAGLFLGGTIHEVAGGRCGQQRQPRGHAYRHHRQDDPGDVAGTGTLVVGLWISRARQPGGHRATGASPCLVRLRLPRAGAGEFAASAAG